MLGHRLHIPNQKTMFVILETCEKLGSFWKHGLFCQSVLNLLRNIFTPWEANFVSATMFPLVDKQGKIDRKHRAFVLDPSRLEISLLRPT